jgi:hypothetical protein
MDSMYDLRMVSITPAEARDYLARLTLANECEIEELRKAPVDLKLRQLWSLMTSADLFEDDAAREADVREVRERWARLYQALRG